MVTPRKFRAGERNRRFLALCVRAVSARESFKVCRKLAASTCGLRSISSTAVRHTGALFSGLEKQRPRGA